MSKLKSKLQQHTKDAEGGIYTAVEAPGGEAKGANMTALFPRKGYSTASARDEILRQKQELLATSTSTAGAGMTKFGQLQVTDADLKALRHKTDTEALINFHTWEQGLYTHDPVRRAWLDSVDPDFAASRIDLMVDRAQFALRVKTLLLRGPRSQEDLILMWGLQSGRIKLDDDWDRIGPSKTSFTSADQVKQQERFKYGLMNPWAYQSDKERTTAQMDDTNPFKPQDATAAGQGQNPSPFGGTVVEGNRYPAFLDRILNA